MTLLPNLLLALLPPALVLALWLRVAGWKAEPPRRVAAAAAGGALAFLAAVGIELLLPGTAAEDTAWFRAFIEAGPREELLVLLAALAAAWPPAALRRSASGVSYALAAAAGFAAAEGVAYGLSLGIGASAGRAFTATPAHLLQGAVLGVGIGRLQRCATALRRARVLGMVLGLAVLFHGAYDFVLLGGGLGRFGLPLFLVVEAVLVAAFVVRAIRRDEAQDVVELAGVPLLRDAGVAAPVLRGLALDSRRIALPAGTVLARQGDPGHSLYVVSEGSLLVRKDGQEAARIPAGGLAGELALLTGETRSADLLAAETSLLLEVPRSALLRAVARTEGLAEALLRVARDRGFQALPAPSALSDEALRACTAEDSRLLADEAVARLRAVPLFAALQAPTLAFLAKELETLEIPAGRGVVRRGSSITSLGVVVSGAMGVEIEGRAVARLQVGDFYGEIGLLSGRVATADVRAISASRIARLDWRAIRGAVGMEPAFGLRLLEAVLDHVAALRAAGGDVEGLSAAGRLARLVDGSELSDVDLGQSTQGLRYGLATEAHMDFAGIRALKQAVDAGGAADFVLSPAGLRRGRGTGGAPPSNGERPLSRDALAAALAQSPELLRALAAQAVVKV